MAAAGAGAGGLQLVRAATPDGQEAALLEQMLAGWARQQWAGP